MWTSEMKKGGATNEFLSTLFSITKADSPINATMYCTSSAKQKAFLVSQVQAQFDYYNEELAKLEKTASSV